ncbi:Tolloid-like protein 1, partial [Schizothecium vesticola]
MGHSNLHFQLRPYGKYYISSLHQVLTWKPPNRENGRVIRVKIINGTPKIKEKIQQYANVWTEYANLSFVFVPDADAEIRVRCDNSGQSWSRVGTDCLATPLSLQTMNLGWLTDTTSDEEFSRVITHEFGHAIGCIHEHQSPAGGIPWDRQAVYKHYMGSQGWSAEQVNINIFNLYSRTTTQFSDFDPDSIMVYSVPAALTINQNYSTPWNTHLSETDKAFISEIYP